MEKEQIIIDTNQCKYKDKYVNYCLAERDNIGESYTICTGTDCYFKQLARKTQECEELKEKNQKLEMQLCNDCGERDDYNIPCKMIRDLDYGLQKEIEENDRYHKALEDVQILAKGIISSNDQPACVYDKECPLNGGVGFDNHCNENCPFVIANQILDIINKAKGHKCPSQKTDKRLVKKFGQKF